MFTALLRPMALLIPLLCANLLPAATTETVFQLAHTSTPLPVRQEKAQALLRCWEMAAPGMADNFRLNTEADLVAVQNSLETLLKNSVGLTTGTKPGLTQEHYLVWTLTRARMLNDLGYDESHIRRFFDLNRSHYPCEPKATVSELLIPATYTDNIGTTAILEEVSERLKKETFPRVAYHINDQLGQKGTGYLGDVTEAQAGAERFALYQKVASEGRAAGGSGDLIGGPFRVPEGYLFLQIHNIITDHSDCFDAYRAQATEDYARQWLKKIYADTLTTAARQLKPEITTFTATPSPSAVALKVDDHELTFAEARAALPHLMGNEKDARFWQSIQRQVLEVELIAHGGAGEAVRATPEYQALLGVQRYLAASHAQIRQILREPVSTATLETWFKENRARYAVRERISYDLYTAGATDATADELGFQAAALKEWRDLQAADSSTTGSHAGIPKIQPQKTAHTSVSVEAQSRPVQVAVQHLAPGEWSPVFMNNGIPAVLHLKAEVEKPIDFAALRNQVQSDYLQDRLQQFWRELLTP